MKPLNRIGYLGGTFDPPHLGHEMVAVEALFQLQLDQVMWLLTPDPPHKKARNITPVDSRKTMLKLITDRYHQFMIGEEDLLRPPPHYAADTVEIIKEGRPGIELVYIIGEDSLQDLPCWHHPERFLAGIDQLAVAPRPGSKTDLAAMEKALPGIENKTVFLADIMVEISSSMIRSRIGEKAPYSHFLRADIAAYIEKSQLYCGSLPSDHE